MCDQTDWKEEQVFFVQKLPLWVGRDMLLDFPYRGGGNIWVRGAKAILFRKVEKILEDSVDLIPSPSPSVKIQIIGGNVYLP